MINYSFIHFSRALIYMYPFNVIHWVKVILVSAFMSLGLGAVFAGTRWRFWDNAWQREPEFEQDNVGDRVGFHYAMLVCGVWPSLMLLAADTWRGMSPVRRDIEDNLYSRFAYIFTKVTCYLGRKKAVNLTTYYQPTLAINFDSLPT